MATGPNLIAHGRRNSTVNRLDPQDRGFHDWYRFVLGYPPHLVSRYLERFDADPKKHVVFDPFCGTGTTPVETKKRGYVAFGTEANPIARFASQVKTNWDVNLRELSKWNRRIISQFENALDAAELNTEVPPLFGKPAKAAMQVDPGSVKASLPKELARVMPYGFISPLPYQKIAILLELVERLPRGPIRDIYRLGIAAILVEGVGNVGFGPEVYMTRPKADAPVLALFSKKIDTMLGDLRWAKEVGLDKIRYAIHQDDARVLSSLGRSRVDIVITSPPYPNEKDYTRSTRLESVMLGFIRNVLDLREIKKNLIKSNTRTIFKNDTDDRHVKHFSSIQKLAQKIERKRKELGKTSGFERLYHRVVTLYFGGMYRHLEALKPHLRSGARLAYVVGDQMSFFRVHIKTGEHLAEIAEHLGYEVEDIELWRERLSTTTKLMLREEVVLLRNP